MSDQGDDINQGSDKVLYCSFCGKSQHEVRKLIAGPTVYICDECVGLLQVSPQTGPFEGGTRVTITGSNLGSSYTQVENSVLIHGNLCMVDQQAYEISRT